MKKTNYHIVVLLAFLGFSSFLLVSCSSGGSDQQGADPAILEAEKPQVDTTRVPELIELYRAKRYESIQEGMAAGVEEVLKLSFHGKKIGALSAEIDRFTYLATLDIANNDLTDLPDELAKLHYLQSFYANGNRFSRFPEQLYLLPLLVRVDLSANQISRIPPEILKMDQLTSLKLEENLITEIPVELYELSKLDVLNLAGNGLSKVPEGIGNLKSLTKLDLSKNQLTSLPKELTSLAGHLEELSIQGNQIPREEIDWFREAMPSTQIRF